MSFTLEDLLPDDQRLRTVQRHDPVQHVIGLMRQHDYNQIPVVDSDGKTSLKEVVTFDSILQAVEAFGTKPELLEVRDVAKRVRTYAADADLLATLDDLQRDNFILIVDSNGLLTGLVTTADSTVFFRNYAQDLMQIEGIESRVKDAIRAIYSGDEKSLEIAVEAVTDRSSDIRRKIPAAIKGYLDKTGLSQPDENHAEALQEVERRLCLQKGSRTFDRLTFDEFAQLLLRHENAPRLNQCADVTELRLLLNRVRDARNKLAHFRGELSEEERRAVHFAATWLERNLPVAIPDQPSPPPVQTEVRTHYSEDEEIPQGIYGAVAMFLRSQPVSIASLGLTFEEIEKILGVALPASAYEYRAWWANDPTKPQSAAWLEEGWRVTGVNMTAGALTVVRTSDRENAYIRFFADLNSILEQISDFPLRKLSPQGQSWHILTSFARDAALLNASFTRRKSLRIELYIDCGDKAKNKERFDTLMGHQAAIESAVGEPLQWERMDDKRSSRIAVYTKGQILTDSDNPVLLDWAAKKVVAFYKAFAPEFGGNPS